ncbi:type II restriction enzyme methylase subunit [Hyphomonas polymorpha PS728]|uniref:site-specific DNA-methyltransferase (adenine-specific) n=1 Tax=Hyphomonas polymorpha PS728 TaxID=1280954 RepID=A0A062VN67_9PROT|nr:DNA methyltransferase [Hyphomonas polymorpha]KCZ99671.1 type II restriction enzyme methylase subunit [Hyphomonas polymorpha PS728]
MLTPGEIYSNLDALAASPPEGGEFGLALMEAVGAPRATITKLRETAKDGAFTWARMLRFEATAPGGAEIALARIREESETSPKSRRPRILLAFDGESIAAFDTKIADEPLRVGLDMLSLEGDIFFPLGGHERYVPAKEKLADVRATRFISRFHDAVRDVNPTWSTEADRHALNIFMARVLFCLFSDDVGIFEKDVFEKAVRQSTKVDGSDLADFLERAFQHMNTRPEDRPSETKGWSKLQYVNGSLFEEAVPMPTLDGRCRKLLLDCAKLNWKLINPDIFGSMLQAVVDVEKRGELGMHYTSPANIMKVLGPILLDELEADLERAGKNKVKLRDFLQRLSRIRIFDPACGSGNFLILAYKEMRSLEIKALRQLAEARMSGIQLEQFCGIEIDDFACEAARLGLWIAKYQCDQQLELDLGQRTDFLPLQKAGVIKRGNAAAVDWLDICTPQTGMETVVVGNPQFKGSKTQSKLQRNDMKSVFANRVKNAGDLDYVAIWFFKAAEYTRKTGAPFALVSTNSIVQGASVPILWPHLLEGLEIKFAHRSFKWSNLAKSNATVTCVIVGMGIPDNKSKRLFDGDIVRDVDLIGPYLAPNVKTIVTGRTRAKGPIAKCLETMMFGNMALDGRNEKCLRMSRKERDEILGEYPNADKFLRPIFGSEELMDGKDIWCIWVRADQVDEANAIEPLKNRFEDLLRVRTSHDAGDDMQKASATPWAFREQNEANSHTIIVPGATSEDRYWLPVDVKEKESIVSNLAFGIFDGEIWQAAILSSRIHRLWLETVGGKLENRVRYSNTLVWNTFPLPPLSDRRKAELEEHWWEIDLARKEAGFGRSLAELYNLKNIPRALRLAHEELDATIETIFGSRRYRSDADRIEHMLQLYERIVVEEASANGSKAKKKATA